MQIRQMRILKERLKKFVIKGCLVSTLMCKGCVVQTQTSKVGDRSIKMAQKEKTAPLEESQKMPENIGMDLLPRAFFTQVTKKQVPVNYKLWTADTNLFYVGERHGVNEQREEMKIILKESGATVLALECLPISAQSYIDDYLAGKNNGSRMKKYLRVRMGDNADSYFSLIKFAKSKNIRVIGLEAPSRGTLDDYKSTADTLSDFISRNKQWIDTVEHYQEKHPKAKIAVFVGSSHIDALTRLHKTKKPPINIDILTNQKVKRKFPLPSTPSPEIWEYLGPWQKIQNYQRQTGASNFAVQIEGKIFVVKGKVYDPTEYAVEK